MWRPGVKIEIGEEISGFVPCRLVQGSPSGSLVYQTEFIFVFFISSLAFQFLAMIQCACVAQGVRVHVCLSRTVSGIQLTHANCLCR